MKGRGQTAGLPAASKCKLHLLQTGKHFTTFVVSLEAENTFTQGMPKRYCGSEQKCELGKEGQDTLFFFLHPCSSSTFFSASSRPLWAWKRAEDYTPPGIDGSLQVTRGCGIPKWVFPRSASLWWCMCHHFEHVCEVCSFMAFCDTRSLCFYPQCIMLRTSSEKFATMTLALIARWI